MVEEYDEVDENRPSVLFRQAFWDECPWGVFACPDVVWFPPFSSFPIDFLKGNKHFLEGFRISSFFFSHSSLLKISLLNSKLGVHLKTQKTHQFLLTFLQIPKTQKEQFGFLSIHNEAPFQFRWISFSSQMSFLLISNEFLLFFPVDYLKLCVVS